VAGIVAGVVDEDVNDREAGEEGVETELEGGDVGEVAVVVGGGVGGEGLEAGDEGVAGSSWTSRKMTARVVWAKASTRAAPMPEAPPVMRTVREWRLG